MRNAATATLLAAALAGCQASTAKLSDGVWAISVGGVANYGVIRGEFGTVVVDSGPGPVAGDELAKLARRLTMCEVTYVVNTSADPRRALGNQSFKRAEIIAHELVGEELRERGDRVLGLLKAHPQAKALGAAECRVVPPTLTYERRTSLRMPDRTVVAICPGGGGGGGDGGAGGGPSPGASVVWLPGERILFAGEYVLVRTAPELPEDGEGVDLAAWIAALDEIGELLGADDDGGGRAARVVPGVGEVTGPECVGWMRDYIAELKQSVDELIASGASLEDAVKTVRMKKYDSWLDHAKHLKTNVAAAYRSEARRRKEQ